MYVIRSPGTASFGISETLSPTHRSGRPKAIFPFQFPKTFTSAKIQLRPKMLVLTMFTTFAAEFAFPVVIIPPTPFPLALLSPVSAKTRTLLRIPARFELFISVELPALEDPELAEGPPKPPAEESPIKTSPPSLSIHENPSGAEKTFPVQSPKKRKAIITESEPKILVFT